MKRTFCVHLCLFILCYAASLELLAVPAPRRLIRIDQPDGSRFDAYLIGDEFARYARTPDGYVALPDANGFYRFAESSPDGSWRIGPHVVMDQSVRSNELTSYVQQLKKPAKNETILRNASIENRLNRWNQDVQLRSSSASRANAYPTKGSVHSLVILVNFSDVGYVTPKALDRFDRMLNEVGFQDDGHIGSVRDYYKNQSNDLFDPTFHVVGPVTLDQPYAYYGANDADNEDTDIRPAHMIRDACVKLDDLIDFSRFDANDDGYVDNIYVFYAGKGEADGGNANTIWPHSWSLQSAGLTLKLDGCTINGYACSPELQGDESTTGIGLFAHEYGHVLGLKDLYDVDYDSYNGQAFDVGEWSLMASGAYNGNSAVPPALTALERMQLGWLSPTELDSLPASVALSDLETSNDAYILYTEHPEEYYLLENRQQNSTGWDAYVPHHGLLVYHIDQRSDETITLSYYGKQVELTFAQLWERNMINAIASHQCADIVEADNIGIVYTGGNYLSYRTSLRGDPFPGSYGITTFTDETVPSMRSWSGNALNKPVSHIREINQKIYFNYRGGAHFDQIPTNLQTTEVEAFTFQAKWAAVEDATEYNLFVQSTADSSAQFQINHIQDTTYTVSVMADTTAYQWSVQASNGFSQTRFSIPASVQTYNGAPTLLTASDPDPFEFVLSWKSFDWADGYWVDVYTLDTNGNKQSVDMYESRFTTTNQLLCTNLDDETTYYAQVRSSYASFSSQASDVLIIRTPNSDRIVPIVQHRTVSLKGAEQGTTIRVYDVYGKLFIESVHPVFELSRSGLYLIETSLKGQTKRFKVVVR